MDSHSRGFGTSGEIGTGIYPESEGQVRRGREIREGATNDSRTADPASNRTPIDVPSSFQLPYPSPVWDSLTPGWDVQSTTSSEDSPLSWTPPAAPRLQTIPLPPLNTTAVLTEVLRCGVMSQIGLAAEILSIYPIEHLTAYAWWQAAATRPGVDRMTINIPLLNEETVVYGSGLCGTVCVGDVIHEIRRCWHRRRRPSYDQPGWAMGEGPSIWGRQLSNSPQSPGSAFRPHRDHEWLGLTLKTNRLTWDLVLVDSNDAW